MDFLKLVRILLRPYLKHSFLLSITIVFELAFFLAFPLALKWMFDDGIRKGDIQLVIVILGGIGIGFFIAFLSSLGRDYISAQIGSYVLRDLRMKMYSHLFRLSPDFFRRSKVGDILSLFSQDLADLEFGLVNGFPLGILNTLLVLGSVILIFVIDWRLALIIICVLPIALLAPKFLGARASEAGYTRKTKEAAVLSVLQENIVGQAVIRTFCLENMMYRKFRENMRGLTQTSIQMHFFSLLTGKIAYMSTFFVLLLVLGVCAVLMTSGSITTGIFLSFMSFLTNIGDAFSDLSTVIPQVIKATGGVRRISEFLSEDFPIINPSHTLTLSRFSNGLCFENITFGYEADHPILHDLCFQIKKGESVALIGRSGSGKSTIINLILGFYHPTIGRVTIDGSDLVVLNKGSPEQVVMDVVTDNTGISQNTDDVRFREVSQSSRAVSPIL